MKKLLAALLLFASQAHAVDHYIDLLVVYSDVIAGYHPDPTERMNYINAPLAAANAVFVNNDLSTELRIVGTMQATGYVESNNSALIDMINPNATLHNDVSAQRDAVGADLVMFISNTSTSPGAAQGTPSNFSAQPYAYALIGHNWWTNGYVVLHEIGHLMGLCHTYASDPYCPNALASAYRNNTVPYYTVMTESQPVTGTVPYFSSATRLGIYNIVLGDSVHADAESLLRTNIPLVEAYRTPPGC
jgi:hypothetical protein